MWQLWSTAVEEGFLKYLGAYNQPEQGMAKHRGRGTIKIELARARGQDTVTFTPLWSVHGTGHNYTR